MRGQGFRAKERYVLWSAALRTRQRSTDTSCASSVSPVVVVVVSVVVVSVVSVERADGAEQQTERQINFPVSVTG